MAGAKEINFAREGKVLRVLPSGRWVPRKLEFKVPHLWIGAQFPQEKFLSYGRILTLHYYFLLMCILFSFILFISY